MKYEDMTCEQARDAIDKCIRSHLAGAVKDEDIHRPIRELGVPEKDIAIKIIPTPIFGRLSEGEFHITVYALATNGDVIHLEIPSGKRPTT